MSEYLFGDNRRVSTLKWGAEFLSVNFWRREKDSGSDCPITLTRYCVPGRVDTYCFDWSPGSSGYGARVRFFTDTGETLPSALKLLTRDLNRKPIAEMLKLACSKHPEFTRILSNDLLDVLAPSSLSARVIRGLYTAQRIKRRKQIEQLRLAQLTSPTGQHK